MILIDAAVIDQIWVRHGTMATEVITCKVGYV